MKRFAGILLLWVLIQISNREVEAQNSKKVCGSNRYGYICCSGWTKDTNGNCALPICDNCGSNGKCVAPNLCQCNNGMKSPSCPEENGMSEDIGACYLKIQRGLCSKGKLDLKLTREICCSVFNVAWGTPCRRCQSNVCPKGFYYRNGGCKDINECSIIPNICGNGRCRNTEGSYKCVCNSGYKYDDDQSACVYFPDMHNDRWTVTDFCGKNPDQCGLGGKCVNTENGQYKCDCSKDYQLNSQGTSCLPRYAYAFNICQYYRNFMCDNGACVPKGRSYECRCNKGYTLSSDKKSCNRRVDVCKLFHGYLCKNGQCISESNDFRCSCNSGYSASYDKKKCISFCDLQEPSICQNGRCIPDSNGFKCECNSGYSVSSDKKSCTKNAFEIGYQNMVAEKSKLKPPQPIIDYCADITYRQRCRGGYCTNTESSYRCDCPSGYIAVDKGTACVTDGYRKFNSDQSLNSKSRQKSNCGAYEALCNNGRCELSGSSFKCICDRGYKSIKDGRRCIDVNECYAKAGICGQGKCVNIPGSYTCSCYNGFTLNVLSGDPICADRDECKEMGNLCENGVCQNTWGSYKCHCHAGYRPDNTEKFCILKEVDYSKQNDRRIAEKPIDCPECSYGCEWFSPQKYTCKCPPYKVHFERSRICGDVNSVMNYQVQLVYNRSKRSLVMDEETASLFNGGPITNSLPAQQVSGHTERLMIELASSDDQYMNKFMNQLSPDSKQIQKRKCTVTILSTNHSRIDCSFIVP